jgi:hypothetical protein
LAGQSVAAHTGTTVPETRAAEPPLAEPPAAEPPGLEPPEAEPAMAEMPHTEAAQPVAELPARPAGHEPETGPATADADHGLVTISDLETAPPPPAAPRQAYSARDTHGQSVAEFFRGMLAARPPALSVSPTKKLDATASGSTAEAEGAPTRPAHDSLSLSSVFGDEGTPTPPAVPVSAASASPAPADGSVSFEEFYSPPGRSDAPRQARTSDTKSDDLDQFHAWLQNLKR